MESLEQSVGTEQLQPTLELPPDLVESFAAIGIEKERIETFGLMRNRTYRVEVEDHGARKSYVYKDIQEEHGRSLPDILQDSNASRILEEIGYPTRRLLMLMPEDNPKSAIYNFVEGTRGGMTQNELLVPENILNIAKDLRKIHRATETKFYSTSNEEKPKSESPIPYVDFCIGYLINDISRLDIPQKEETVEAIRLAAQRVHQGVFALIHADINQFNILWSEQHKPTLIDWGYSEFGDPSRDIANLLLHIHKENPEQFEELFSSILAQYEGTAEQIKRNFNFYLGLRYLTYGRVGIIRAGDANAIKLIERGRNLLHSYSENPHL